MTKYILCDIEGTTTPITFVHEVLFPFSAKHLAHYVEAHLQDSEVQKVLTSANETAKDEFGLSLGREGVIALLLKWIEEDRKHPALKKIQGMIWRQGYESEAFTSKIYDDVPKQMRAWKDAGKDIGIYSSGSVEAQKLLFRYTDHGDLTGLLSHYFDTSVGGKRDDISYKTILEELDLAGTDVVFLSDIEEELDAAKSAGLSAIQLIRPGTKPSTKHPTAKDFFEVDSLIA